MPLALLHFLSAVAATWEDEKKLSELRRILNWFGVKAQFSWVFHIFPFESREVVSETYYHTLSILEEIQRKFKYKFKFLSGVWTSSDSFWMHPLGVVRKLRHRFGGKGDRRICDSPNTKFLFLWKICDKGGGGLKSCFFAWRNLRTTP